MFWDSVMAGLKVLAYWETYLAGLEYFAIFFIPMAIIGIMMEKSEGAWVASGCLSMLLLPILQVAAMAIFVLTLAPIIFGFSEDAAWIFPWTVLTLAPAVFLKLIGVMVVISIVLAFIPILGRLSSLRTLVLGGIALMFVLAIMESANPGIVKGHVDFVPSFWFSVGLLVIGGVMSWIGMMVAALIATGLEMTSEGIGHIVMFPVGAIFGFIPLFMYGAWLGAQVKGSF